jgi:hypothetical protein
LVSFSPLLAWFYETRAANFYQGLSPEQKLENPTFTGAIHHQPPVLGQDERREVLKDGHPVSITRLMTALRKSLVKSV